MGTVTSLSMSAPRPKHFVGRVRAEEPDPEDPEDPGDPASSPSLLDKRMEIDSQPSGGWLGLATVCGISTSESNAAFVLPRRQAEQCSTASVPRKSWPRQEVRLVL